MDDERAGSSYRGGVIDRRRAADIGVIAAVAVAMMLAIAVAEEEDATRSPDVLAYAIGFGVAGLLAARRQWPMGVLLGSVGLLWLYYSLDYPAFSPAVPLAAAAYYAALAGHIRAAAAVVGGMILVGAGWQTVGENESLWSILGTQLLADGGLLAAVLLLGELVRNRRAWAEEVAERRVQGERLRIARELHDVMAHTIAALNVQAGVAADVIDDSPAEAKAALRTIREQSRAAIGELKAAVGVLRDSPAPGLAGLDTLTRMASGAGVETAVTVAGTVRPLPGTVDLTAYRIVQESLTNVVRHAQARTASVVVRYEPEKLVLEILDDGRGGGVNGSGHGLVGMRERAAAVGGTLEARPMPGGGFRVHAELPT
jgi:signal transduction histidine kinase